MNDYSTHKEGIFSKIEIAYSTRGDGMKKILVFGGTRFFGKQLVELLIAKGYDVTICTRGQAGNPFGEQVRHIIADRTSRESLCNAFANAHFDLVYDNICYSPNDASILCEVFGNRIGKLVFTSTLATYPADGMQKQEVDFNPYDYPLQNGNASDFTYGEGKRLAEAVFYKKAQFPVVAVRFPIVLGEDDYTERLHFYVRKALNEEPIVMQNVHAKMGFILAAEAARFLAWAGEADIEGPYNAVANGEVTLVQLFSFIEQATDQKIQVAIGEVAERTPYDIPNSWYMTNKKAQEAGFSFTKLKDWLPELIVSITKAEE